MTLWADYIEFSRVVAQRIELQQVGGHIGEWWTVASIFVLASVARLVETVELPIYNDWTDLASLSLC